MRTERRNSRTSRCPRVPTKAQGAPFFSSRAFVTMVVAWLSNVTASAPTPFREIQRSRRHLGDADPSRLFLDHRDVREGAADVHSDAPGHWSVSLFLLWGQTARAMARGTSPASPSAESGPTSFSTSGITSAPKRSSEAAAIRIGMSPNWKKQL